MLLESIEKHPQRSLRYLERYVNDGSPSGFTEKYRTSSATDPFGFTPWFHPYFHSYEERNIEIFGSIPESLVGEEGVKSNWFIIHPDMSSHPDLQRLNIEELQSLQVVPTSSGRTVQVLNYESSPYIKLHYDGIIGRIDRKLFRMRAISGPENSTLILREIKKGVMPEHFCILHETGAKILFIQNESCNVSEWGMVWREGRPQGENANLINYLIPLFAMWSIDRLRAYDPPILESLCKRWGKDASFLIVYKILIPILESYFNLITKLGFQMELNAQNILLGFDSNWIPIAIVLRDMMGIERDLDLRRSLRLSTDFASSPYKILEKEQNPELYRIRHSFVFDFKIGTYVIDPVIECAIAVSTLSKDKTIMAIREKTSEILKDLPDDFFPVNGKWYRHDRVLLDKDRYYVEDSNPRFR